MAKNTRTCQIHKKYGGLIKCSNPALESDHEGLCILHSQDKAKDPEAFKKALLARWQEDAEFYDFRCVFFPDLFVPQNFFCSSKFAKFEFAKFADFSGATFQSANFLWATFQGARFNEATFTDWADFNGATFTGRADFSRATFTGRANFSSAYFKWEANFIEATFTAKPHFFRTYFKKETNFSKARFAKGADFEGVTFNQSADFSKASFMEETDFFEATFNWEADFSSVAGDGPVVFQSVNSLDDLFVGDFRFIGLKGGALLRFQNLSLAHCKFVGSDLRREEFRHITWHPYQGRQALYDEVLLRQNEKENPWFWNQFWAWVSSCFPLQGFALELGPALSDYSSEANPTTESPWGNAYGEVERLYRDLQENYEQARDYKKMGDFHYGEMEMHRRANKWRWFPFYWYNLYWALSGYGERPSRALGWLAAFLFGLSTFVWWFGLPATANGFLDALSYVFEKATFQRPKAPDGLNWFGGLVANLGLLLIPGQAALFLLALRNRLGRRR